VCTRCNMREQVAQISRRILVAQDSAIRSIRLRGIGNYSISSAEFLGGHGAYQRALFGLQVDGET